MPAQIPVPISLDLQPDFRVMWFTLAVTLVTGLVFGLAPALRASKADVVSALKIDMPALRLGGRRFSLQGATLYASCEPCPMCLAAAYWARVSRIVFANTREEAAAIGFDDQLLYDEIPKPIHQRLVPTEHVPHPEAKAVFKDWLQKEKDFTPMPDGLGWFNWFGNISLYMEVISWTKLLRDAEMRNKIFFNKLGID